MIKFVYQTLTIKCDFSIKTTIKVPIVTIISVIFTPKITCLLSNNLCSPLLTKTEENDICKHFSTIKNSF